VGFLKRMKVDISLCNYYGNWYVDFLGNYKKVKIGVI